MDIFHKIAERKIQEAMENGEFNDLPNRGKPLQFEDDSFIPEELRIGYRVLKHAGCIPPELDLRNEIISLRGLINSLDDDRERMKKIREFNFKLLKLNELLRKSFNLEDFPEYEEKIYRKFL
jgi:hypothetical protein